MTETIKDIQGFVGDVISKKRTLPEIPSYKNIKFMFSASELFAKKKKLSDIKELGFNRYVKYSGASKNRADSGSYSVFRKNGTYPDIKKCIEIYRAFGSDAFDQFAVIDRVTNPLDPQEKIVNNILDTNSNLLKMRSLAPNLPICHVIQGFTPKQIKLAFEPVMNANEDLIMIGSFFPLLGKKGIKKSIIVNKMINVSRFINDNRRLFENTHFHGLGASGTSSAHICVYAGLTHFDSSGARLRASYGKICFAGDRHDKGVPEAYIGNGNAKFGVTEWRTSFDSYLSKCDCPMCTGLSLEDKKFVYKFSFESRLIHNVYQFLKEIELARELAPYPKKYYNYLINVRFKDNTFYRKWVEKIHACRDTKDILGFVKNPSLNDKTILEEILFLTSCSKAKIQTHNSTPAQNLYAGQIFKKVNKIRKYFHCNLRIISAKYGLLHPLKYVNL